MKWRACATFKVVLWLGNEASLNLICARGKGPVQGRLKTDMGRRSPAKATLPNRIAEVEERRGREYLGLTAGLYESSVCATKRCQ
jgi:hypothetical protein